LHSIDFFAFLLAARGGREYNAVAQDSSIAFFWAETAETFWTGVGLIRCPEEKSQCPACARLRPTRGTCLPREALAVCRAEVVSVLQGATGMLRKVIGAALVLVLSAGFVFADEIRAVITKVEGNKVTFAPIEGKGKDAKKGPEKTLPVSKDLKVVGMKRNPDTKKFEPGDAIEGGLKAKMFSEISEKGVGGMIVTDDDNKTIKEIRVFQKKKKDS
jgi:hypothetical protein